MNLLSVAVFCAGLVYAHASPSPADVEPGSCQAKMTAFPLDPGSKCCTHKSLVRLGDYDLNHEGKDCVTVEGGGSECNDGAISIAIETTITHPNYSPRKSSKANDIGLIRLKEVAPYTEYIRPICLPTKNVEKSPPDHPLYAVGWNDKTNVKTIYTTPFVSQEKCQPIYNTSGRKMVFEQSQLCAGGIEGMDPCKGDGGGPLVYENEEGLSELVGTVSFGPFPCGQKDFPSVYSNIYEHLDWIKTNIVA